MRQTVEKLQTELAVAATTIADLEKAKAAAEGARIEAAKARLDAETAREWACLGWLALGDLAKYLDRGSVWEAHARLEEARAQVWKLWALAISATSSSLAYSAEPKAPD